MRAGISAGRPRSSRAPARWLALAGSGRGDGVDLAHFGVAQNPIGGLHICPGLFGFVAPEITDATVGLAASQAMASSRTVCPWSLA